MAKANLVEKSKLVLAYEVFARDCDQAYGASESSRLKACADLSAAASRATEEDFNALGHVSGVMGWAKRNGGGLAARKSLSIVFAGMLKSTDRMASEGLDEGTLADLLMYNPAVVGPALKSHGYWAKLLVEGAARVVEIARREVFSQWHYLSASQLPVMKVPTLSDVRSRAARLDWDAQVGKKKGAPPESSVDLFGLHPYWYEAETATMPNTKPNGELLAELAGALDEALSDQGILSELGSAAPGVALGFLAHGNAGRFRQMVDHGVDISKATQDQMCAALWGLTRMGDWWGPAEGQSRKIRLWSMAVEAGLPTLDKDAAWTAVFRPWDADGFELLASEARRGAAMPAAFFPHFVVAALCPRLEDAPVAFGGVPALEWLSAFNPSSGKFDAEVFLSILEFVKPPAQVDAALAGLAACGAKFGPDDGALLRALGKHRAGQAGYEAAWAMGIDLFAVSKEGLGAAAALAGEHGSKTSPAETLSALLAAADKARPGGGKELAKQLGTAGETPLHHAAKALRADCIGLLARYGGDPLAVDANGETVAHWAGKRYGEKVRDRAREAFGALTALGVDWSALDAKGRSAMAALTKRSPIEALADVLHAQPDSLEAGGGCAGSKTRPKTAMENLAERGAHAMAIGEKALFEAGSATSDAPRVKFRRKGL